jgi:hypothetical protein
VCAACVCVKVYACPCPKACPPDDLPTPLKLNLWIYVGLMYTHTETFLVSMHLSACGYKRACKENVHDGGNRVLNDPAAFKAGMNAVGMQSPADCETLCHQGLSQRHHHMVVHASSKPSPSEKKKASSHAGFFRNTIFFIFRMIGPSRNQAVSTHGWHTTAA